MSLLILVGYFADAGRIDFASWEIRVHIKPENRHSGGILKVFQGIRRIIPVEEIREF